MGQTEPINHINDMGQLSLLALHILEPGRSIEEEIFYLDFRSNWTAGRLMLFDLTTLGNQQSPVLTGFRCSLNGKTRDRSNRRNGLATKTQCPNPKEICLLLDFTGSMASKSQRHIFVIYALTIIRHLDSLESSLFDFDGNLTGTRIN